MSAPALTRSQQMSRIRGVDTSPERTLRTALWSAGLRGYRVNARTPAGRADVAFARARVAVFIDGCFWHGCPGHYVRPRSRDEFWAAKLRTNVDRDRRQTLALETLGWRVCRAWEHEVFEDTASVVERVREALAGAPARDDAAWRVTRVDVLDAAQDLEQRTLETLRDGSRTRIEVRRRTTRKWRKPG